MSRLGDEIVAKLMRDPERTEVLAWLKEDTAEKRTLGELPSTEASIVLAEGAYRAGAAEVWVVDISRSTVANVEDEVMRASGGKLIVRLPEDSSSRTRFFRWEAEQAHSLGFDARRDEGQSHLFVPLD